MANEPTNNLMPAVREVFLANVPDADLPKFQDKLKLFYMRSLDFLQQNKLDFTKENLVKYADKIKTWEIVEDLDDAEIETEDSIEEQGECVCKTIPKLKDEIAKMKKIGLVITVFLLIVVVFK